MRVHADTVPHMVGLGGWRQARHEYFAPREHALYRRGTPKGYEGAVCVDADDADEAAAGRPGASPFSASSDADLFLVGLTPEQVHALRCCTHPHARCVPQSTRQPSSEARPEQLAPLPWLHMLALCRL